MSDKALPQLLEELEKASEALNEAKAQMTASKSRNEQFVKVLRAAVTRQVAGIGWDGTGGERSKQEMDAAWAAVLEFMNADMEPAERDDQRDGPDRV